MNVGPEGSELIAGVVRRHGGGTGLPARGADLTVLIGVLVALHEAEDLVNVPADGEVVHREVAEDALAVDDVSGAESHTIVIRVFKEAAVVAGNLLGDVSDHRHVHGAKTALLSGLKGVLAVSEVGVDGAANDLRVDGLELAGLVAELADLGRAHKGEIERPEEEDNVLACTSKRSASCALN